MKTPVPLFIVFRAFGVISDKDICEIICAGDVSILPHLRASVVDANEILTQEKAIIYLTNVVMYTPINVDKETGSLKKTSFMMDVLNNDIFPHCRTKEQRVHFMGYMVNKLIKCSIGSEQSDDRDSFTNKRIDTTGILLLNLFRNYFNKMVKDIQKQIIREINIGSWRSTEDFGSVVNMTNMYKIIKSTTIENGIKRALSTGDFGVKQPNTNKVGVAQVLNRLTYVSALSHLRRVNTPIDKTCKLIPPRKLHPTSWGFTCPAESPEGGSVGVVKNLSYLAHITTSSNGEILQDIILPYIVPVGGDKSLVKSSVKMFINGSWIGITDSPKELYQLLKDKKHQGIINIYTSIVFNYNMREIRICNDAGRIMRPVLRVKNNNLILSKNIVNEVKFNKLNWDDLLINGNISDSVIEYIDPEEQALSMIAMKPKDLINTNANEFYLNPFTGAYKICELSKPK
jgi:DNA-directed RNA polymerase II subunit RPB2